MIDISIIVPCYNHGAYIKETLESIKNCGVIPYSYEVIIVNDGSTDRPTMDVLKEIENEGYFIIHQQNQGLGAARNNGIKLAKGRYILPLDSDNMVCRPYLTTAIDIMENDPACSIVYGDAEYIGERSGRWVVGEYNLQKLMIKNYIDACTVFRKEVWMKTGGYDENIPVMGLEDWDLWLKSSFSGFKFQYIKEVCFFYRVLHTSMIKKVDAGKLRQIDEYFRKKYPSYLNKDYLNEVFLVSLKLKKKKLFKLIIAVFYPGRLLKFFKSGKIENEIL